MADENKIQLDVELSESSIDNSFKAIDKRAEKSAKESAAVFGEYFQKQENELKDSIDRIVGETRKTAQKSAKESAAAFAEAFEKQDKIYKASVKQNIDNAINAITGSNNIKKSAQESASVFEEAFAKEITGNKSIDKALNAILPAADASAAMGTGLARLAVPLAAVTAGIVALGVAAKETFDLIIAGEKEIKLENKFKVLAQQAGIAGDAIRDDLTKAVDGLVGESELLQLASETFIQLGNNAKQLPQILELARKTYAVFGGDVVKNTEAITNAIFTGQTRQLKQLGILVDTEKVYKDYARTLGTVVPLLSEQQKQQALLNEVLRQGNERFRNVDVDGGKATDAVKRFSVAVGELKDQLAILASNTLGQTLADAANSVSKFVAGINKAFQTANNPADQVEKLNMQIRYLTGSIKGAEEQLRNFNAVERFFLEDSFKESIQEKSALLVKYQKELEEATRKQAAEQAAAANTGAVAGQPSTVSDEYLRRKQELVAKVQSLNEQLAASELQLAQDEFTREQTRANLEAVTYQQRYAAELKFQQDKSQLEKFFADNGINDVDLRNQAREALESQHVNNLLKIDKTYIDNKKKLEKAANDSAYNATSTALGQIATLQQNASDELAAIGKAAAITKATMDGYVAVQNALAQVPYPFNFAAAALVGVAAAANVAKIASIGGSEGGGGSAAFQPGTGGTPGLPNTGPIVEAPLPTETVAEVPATSINLTINGNVLDRRETGLEIAQILEEQFADQGLVIRGA